MTTYTAATSAFLKSNVTVLTAARVGVTGAEITYTADVSPETLWADDSAADLVIDAAGLTPGEWQVERGTVCRDAAGTLSERVRFVRG